MVIRGNFFYSKKKKTIDNQERGKGRGKKGRGAFTRVTESFSTLAAVEWFLSCVKSTMLSQVMLVLKRLLTNITRKRALSCTKKHKNVKNTLKYTQICVKWRKEVNCGHTWMFVFVSRKRTLFSEDFVTLVTSELVHLTSLDLGAFRVKVTSTRSATCVHRIIRFSLLQLPLRSWLVGSWRHCCCVCSAHKCWRHTVVEQWWRHHGRGDWGEGEEGGCVRKHGERSVKWRERGTDRPKRP